MSDLEREQLIQQFVTVTNSSEYLAEQYLTRNKNDLINAIEDYYATSSSSAGHSGRGKASSDTKEK